MATKKLDKKLSEQIVGDITDNKIKMHSSRYFVLLGVGAVVSAILLTLLAAILSRMLFDDIDAGRRAGLLRFGPEGRRMLVEGFPWLLMFITFITIWGTIKVYKKTDFSYRHSGKIFYGTAAGIILLLAIIAGNNKITGPLSRHELFSKLQTVTHQVKDNALWGELKLVGDQEIIVIMNSGEEVTVDTSQARKRGLPKVGGGVEALGRWLDDDNFKSDVVKFGNRLKYQHPRFMK